MRYCKKSLSSYYGECPSSGNFFNGLRYYRPLCCKYIIITMLAKKFFRRRSYIIVRNESVKIVISYCYSFRRFLFRSFYFVKATEYWYCYKKKKKMTRSPGALFPLDNRNCRPMIMPVSLLDVLVYF